MFCKTICKRPREHPAFPHLVKAGFEVKAFAVLVYRPEVPVQGGLVPLRPPPLARRAAALENVFELLFARSTPEDGFSQGELRSETPAK